MKANTYEATNAHRRNDKVIAALIVNGPDAATLREAARAGIRMKQYKQALKMHGAQARKER